MQGQWSRTGTEVSNPNIDLVDGSTYDTPLETQQDLANQENLLAGGEEHDEKEGRHHTQSAQDNFPWAKSSDKPSIEDCTKD